MSAEFLLFRPEGCPGWTGGLSEGDVQTWWVWTQKILINFSNDQWWQQTLELPGPVQQDSMVKAQKHSATSLIFILTLK